MKRTLIILLIWGFILFGCYCAYMNHTQPKQKFIDYPEEIRNAKQGDSLIISRVTKDTVYLEFNNLRNR